MQSLYVIKREKSETQFALTNTHTHSITTFFLKQCHSITTHSHLSTFCSNGLASVRTLLAQGASERLVCHARERAHQQWARAAPNVATPPERRPRCHPLPTRIPCTTPDLLLKHPDATVATYKKNTDETLETNV